jgi:hypothetical protein
VTWNNNDCSSGLAENADTREDAVTAYILNAESCWGISILSPQLPHASGQMDVPKNSLHGWNKIQLARRSPHASSHGERVDDA